MNRSEDIIVQQDTPQNASVGHSPTKRTVALEVRVVTGSGGGPDKTILNTPRFLTQYGYDTICAYMRPPRDANFDILRERALAWQAPLVEIHDRGPLDFRVVAQLIRLCRQQQVAIWHGHDYKSNLLGLLVRRFWPMRLVTTVHGWVKFTARTPFYYALDRLSLKSYERVVCVSPDLLEQCLSAGIPGDRCVLIENAIHTDEFARRRSSHDAKQQLGFRPDRLLIGAVGRLSSEKGFDILIRAAAQLFDSGLEFDLCIAGDGDQRPQLESLIKSLGHDDRIHLLGFRADTIDLYQAMDLFVLSSLREGLPNVLLEAMAIEVPVIATEIAGVPRLIDNLKDGLLVAPGSVGELATAMKRLVEDCALRQRLSLAGREKIECRYSFDTRMQKIAAVYGALVESVSV